MLKAPPRLTRDLGDLIEAWFADERVVIDSTYGPEVLMDHPEVQDDGWCLIKTERRTYELDEGQSLPLPGPSPLLPRPRRFREREGRLWSAGVGAATLCDPVPSGVGC